jgi:hypothetical protein
MSLLYEKLKRTDEIEVNYNTFCKLGAKIRDFYIPKINPADLDSLNHLDYSIF